MQSSDFFLLSCATNTRGHPYKLYKPRCYSGVRESFFSQRAINVWNSLPAEYVDFSSFAAFKRTVQDVDFTAFLKCPI